MPNLGEFADVVLKLHDLVLNDVKHLTGNAGGREREAEVRALSETIDLALKPTPYNYMIHNLQEPYEQKLDGVPLNGFQRVKIYEKLYGVWIFESGTFENFGVGTDENWCFGSKFKRVGEKIKLFRNPWTLCTTSYYGDQGRKIVFERR